MKRICSQCQTEMIEDLAVAVEYDLSGITIRQKREGFFKSITAKAKAAVCPNCGNLLFYVDDYAKFSKEPE